MWSSIVPPSRVYKAGGRRRFHAMAAPFAPNHSVDPLQQRPDSPFQRRLQFDAQQLPCQCNAILKALPIQGARLIDAWRTLPPRERQSVALILCMVGCVVRPTESGGSYSGDGAVWHVLSIYSRV
jgi:hypothetical protein